jgi:putative flippase GtrA
MQVIGWNVPILGKFLTVGALNTLVGLAVIYIAKWFFQFGDIAANATGYAVGLILSFVLNSRWTFGYEGQWIPALARFLSITLLAYGMNLLVVLLAIRVIGTDDYLAHALGILPYTLTVYLGSKYIAFPAKSGSGR